MLHIPEPLFPTDSQTFSVPLVFNGLIPSRAIRGLFSHIF